jgi:hypothetical protein
MALKAMQLAEGYGSAPPFGKAPTARELLDDAQEAIRRITSGMAPMRIPADPADADRVLAVLAARVEKVLALKSVYAPELLDRIRRILNGEEE